MARTTTAPSGQYYKCHGQCGWEIAFAVAIAYGNGTTAFAKQGTHC
jgi:hypothetical protein